MTVTSEEERLAAAWNAYCVTREAPLDSIFESVSEFDRYLQAHSFPRLALSDVLLLRRCSRSRDRGLAAAREGKLVSAAQALEESSAILEREPMSAEALQLATSFQRAAEAYVHYRSRNAREAVACVMEALWIDAGLIEDAGYSILALHRVQLVHNLMRIARMTTGPVTASEMGLQLLRYLERRSVDSLPGAWRPGDLESIPEPLVERMYVQIVTELAALLASAKGDSLAILAQRLTAQVDATDDNCSVSPASQVWMREKLCLLSGDRETCLEYMPGLLVESRVNAPTIWSCTAFDLAAVCRAIDSCFARSVRDMIFADARDWHWLPHNWRAIWKAEWGPSP
jgi:hypothetical protein